MSKWEYDDGRITGPHWKDKAMAKWEYETNILPTGHGLQEALEAYGEEGWELVTFDFNGGTAIFKRPTRPEPPALLVVNNIPGAEFEQLAESIKAELGRYWEEKDDDGCCDYCRELRRDLAGLDE